MPTQVDPEEGRATADVSVVPVEAVGHSQAWSELLRAEALTREIALKADRLAFAARVWRVVALVELALLLFSAAFALSR